MQLYMSWYIRSFFGFTFLNILFFSKYSCTYIFHRRSLYTFYLYWDAPRSPATALSVQLFRNIPMMTLSNGSISALLALCAENSPVPGEFPSQRPVTQSFDAFFDLRLNKRLSKQSRGWWFETLSRPLWRHRNVYLIGPWWRYMVSIKAVNIVTSTSLPSRGKYPSKFPQPP